MSGAAIRPLLAIRPQNWWRAKIPPLLAIAYLAITGGDAPALTSAALLASYLCAVCLVAAFGHVINDTFDVETDLRAGKPNQLTDTNWSTRILLCLLFLLASYVPALTAHYSALALLLLTLNLLWPAIYSLPGIRLKERGLAGLACDALGSHVTPTLLALAVFGTAAGHSAAFPFVIALWATVLGIKGILHHQIGDRANDLRSGTVTFATRAQPNALIRFLTFFNLYIELPVSAVLAIVTWRFAPLIALVFVVYCAIELIKSYLGFRFALTAEPWTVRRSVPFANETFYIFWLPIAAALQLAIHDPFWIWLPIAHVVLFYPTAIELIAEIRGMIVTAENQRRLGR
ncbi:UbiA family prenyltransferase [Bradyrhizobium jicamae]|uniref:UbiA family prenyltransferase n=1 Tax=Bradyrhizobium jicamae TaxID=280332 RepID=UPI001BAAD6ED|nr:UbiA family prenyltransferase [Bradyrhizobium jicamae]MBR0757111.1 UbiA family prenyltransferase [Bradyrhizobium jicamae]